MSQGEVLRIANCSGFFGDRLTAAREMLEGGPIDVLTGDWLAELTLGVLAKQRRRNDAMGYAETFVHQLEDVLFECVKRGVKVVSNAGGLNPAGCAARVRELAGRLGVPVRVAIVDGDDATDIFRRARERGRMAPHLDSGEPLDPSVEVDIASAYLGGWGIAEALRAGADVVVTGRVADASLTVGPAAWYFDWEPTAWDTIAGAVAAGHIIECGAHATGGNFAFFRELDRSAPFGFPIAEISADGSSVITKHPGTGGAVTVDTVTAQLLYEVDGPRYLTPDAVVRLDTIQLESAGPDRVRVSNVRGEQAPDMVKVGALITAGWRNEVTFVLTGLDIEAKADFAQAALWQRIPGGEAAFEQVEATLLRADRPYPATMSQATALLTITVLDPDQRNVARFPRLAVETGLASYPGLHFAAPPNDATQVPVFWPTLMPAEGFVQRVTLDEANWPVSWRTVGQPTLSVVAGPELSPASEPWVGKPTARRPLGTVLGARSGDKAGNATLGVWTRTADAYDWLRSWWSVAMVRKLLPEADALELRAWELPQLRACGVTIVGLLGRGVAANLRLDPQAKGLGEYLRAKPFEIPVQFLDQS
jgi:hypothetical protein